MHPFHSSKPDPPYKQWTGPYAEHRIPDSLNDNRSSESELMKNRFLPFPLRLKREDSYIRTVRYHDHPEGEDLMGKLVAVNHLIYQGCLANGAMGFMQEKSQSLGSAFLKGYQYTWPGFAIASAFVATTFFSTNLRGKDDYLNYQLGGVGAGIILGGVHRSHILGVGSSIFFGKILFYSCSENVLFNGFCFFLCE